MEVLKKGSFHAAVVGCTHGELDLVYQQVKEKEDKHNIKIDIVLCCGDFEAVRNDYDLDCLTGPSYYHYYKDYYKYYNGEKTAPVLTVFVGGNHEAVNHLREIPLGGWAAPNIYFLGYSGVITFGGARIAGFSGIYKEFDYTKGHFEVPPYTENTKRSAFHVKEFELWKLQHLSGKLDVIMSHDWPRGVTCFGNEQKLLQDRPYFVKEVNEGTFGCVHYQELMKQHKPDKWISGHMHAQFSATYLHDDGSKTEFLAFDKVYINTDFLGVIEITPSSVSGDGEKVLSYDEEWLAIVKSSIDFIPKTSKSILPQSIKPEVIKENLLWVKENITATGKLRIPNNFYMSATPHKTGEGGSSKPSHRITEGSIIENTQTEIFAHLLNVPLEALLPDKSQKPNRKPNPNNKPNPDNKPKGNLQKNNEKPDPNNKPKKKNRVQHNS